MFVVLVITRLLFSSLAEGGVIKSLKMGALIFLQKREFNILAGRKIAAVLSVVVIVGSWFVFIQKGDENLGVDFTGGTVITYTFHEKAEIETVRSVLEEAGYPNAKIAYQQALDGAVYLEVKVGSSGVASEAALEAVKGLPGNYTDIQNESVGSQIGKELKSRGVKAILLSLVGIIIYISLRFEFAYAMGAIAALAHDVLVTVGLFCLFGHELSMPIIAALLTIVGYSVNDTIVVFDRIREDLKLKQGLGYEAVANLAINQTLSRTVLTSFTTLLTVIMLLVFGGGAVADFALALLIGILAGTYSSIFVATPVMLSGIEVKK